MFKFIFSFFLLFGLVDSSDIGIDLPMEQKDSSERFESKQKLDSGTYSCEVTVTITGDVGFFAAEIECSGSGSVECGEDQSAADCATAACDIAYAVALACVSKAIGNW